MTGHQVSSASEEYELIGSHWQPNIPKWQHLIRSFCPAVSLALSLPLSRLSVTLHRAPLPHYLPTPQLTNKYAVTWMNKHAAMCSVFLLCIFSPDIFALLCLSASQVTSCCLRTTTRLPPLSISPLLLLMRLSNATAHPQQRLWWAAKTTKPSNMQSERTWMQREKENGEYKSRPRKNSFYAKKKREQTMQFISLLNAVTCNVSALLAADLFCGQHVPRMQGSLNEVFKLCMGAICSTSLIEERKVQEWWDDRSARGRFQSHRSCSVPQICNITAHQRSGKTH